MGVFFGWKIIGFHHLKKYKNQVEKETSLSIKVIYHILNRSPTLAVKNKTPKEGWRGFKPSLSLSYFIVFGSISHALVPDCKRAKLDDKSLKCIFFGVNEKSKSYRLYDPISQRIIISSDMVFEEDNNWNWGKHNEESILVDLN